MFRPVLETKTAKPRFRGCGRGIGVGSRDEERQVNVLTRGQSREQAEGLEYHAELAGPPARHLGCGQFGEQPPVPPHNSAIRSLESSDEAEQRTLSRARRSHDD